ncbi:MAG: response regulator [Candidatus Saccharibacteria bacterium]|nr:response regulator [Candidatus Saccharibacteria bacterium]
MQQDTTPTPQPQTGKSVLCIEDEHFIGELYTRALTRAGYEINVVIDGVEGLKEAQTNKYDIILLDMMVPNLTGFEILKRLRDPSITPKLDGKIIITTNLEQGDEAKAEIENQADGYVVKAEITPKQLVKFLDQLDT